MYSLLIKTAMRLSFRLRLLVCLWLMPVVSVNADTILEVGSISGGAQRAELQDVAKSFESRNPGVKVKFLVDSDVSYTRSLDTWMEKQSGPSLLYWQGGERLQQYIRAGKVLDLSEFWRENGLKSQFSKASRKTVSYKGRQYAVPYSHYHWGFYYRKSLFKKLNLKTPRSWKGFLALCEELKKNDITPIMLSTKNHWPSAAWFDYLNLRLNGLPYHKKLLAGERSFKSSRVKRVFKRLKTIVDNGYVISNPERYDWKSALPSLYHEKTGMILLGSFFATEPPQAVLDDFAFFPFPKIKRNVPVYEESPVEVYMIPKHAEQKELALEFLKLLASPEVQTQINRANYSLPANLLAKTSEDYFVKKAKDTLSAAEGFSQYFDRDTEAAMAQKSMEIIASFFNDPDIEKTMESLEQARLAHFYQKQN